MFNCAYLDVKVTIHAYKKLPLKEETHIQSMVTIQSEAGSADTTYISTTLNAMPQATKLLHQNTHKALEMQCRYTNALYLEESVSHVTAFTSSTLIHPRK